MRGTNHHNTLKQREARPPPEVSHVDLSSLWVVPLTLTSNQATIELIPNLV